MPTHAPTKKPALRKPAAKAAHVVRPPAVSSSLSHAELMEIVRRNPPPPEWFEDDSDPFTPAAAESVAK